MKSSSLDALGSPINRPNICIDDEFDIGHDDLTNRILNWPKNQN